MSEPIAICIEDLDPPDESRRYLQCTALGEANGLGLDADGTIRWRQGPLLLQLCVSGDEQLLLYLPADAAFEAVLRRDRRSLVLPPERPVEVLDQDLLEVGGRRLCIHVHGVAVSAHPPRWLDLTADPPRPQTGGRARAAAAALAVGASLGAGACDDPKPVPQTNKTQQAATKQAVEQQAPDARIPDAALLKPDAVRLRPDARVKRVIKRKKKIKVRIRPPVPLKSNDPFDGL